LAGSSTFLAGHLTKKHRLCFRIHFSYVGHAA
jgi:hypothetical protein